jgi:glutamate synthase (NADPH/NADH) small chain
VNFVEKPYRRPAYRPTDPLTAQNAWVAAADCQGCQEPACVEDCPASIDIPGFMRRMEAQNYEGASRVIRERNPFGEVCGLLCAADQLCQRRCYRREFTGKPVRIAELQRWVCAQAGEKGWPRTQQAANGAKVAISGGGPAALSCAYYLALAGCRVTILSIEARPAAKLWETAGSSAALQESLRRELDGILSTSVQYQVVASTVGELDLDALRKEYQAVYLSASVQNGQAVPGSGGGRPGVFYGKEVRANGFSVVEAAAQGRETAGKIWQFLKATG